MHVAPVFVFALLSFLAHALAVVFAVLGLSTLALATVLALLDLPTLAFVFVFALLGFLALALAGHLERRPVKVGQGTAALLEVIGGLDEGEEVVLDPALAHPDSSGRSTVN